MNPAIPVAIDTKGNEMEGAKSRGERERGREGERERVSESVSVSFVEQGNVSLFIISNSSGKNTVSRTRFFFKIFCIHAKFKKWTPMKKNCTY